MVIHWAIRRFPGWETESHFLQTFFPIIPLTTLLKSKVEIIPRYWIEFRSFILQTLDLSSTADG
jgi:hypothetical protein